MSVKAILMKDRSMVKSTCTILGRLGHSYLQPIITSSASPFLANSLLHVGQGGAKKTQVSDFQNGKAVSHP